MSSRFIFLWNFIQKGKNLILMSQDSIESFFCWSYFLVEFNIKKIIKISVFIAGTRSRGRIRFRSRFRIILFFSKSRDFGCFTMMSFGSTIFNIDNIFISVSDSNIFIHIDVINTHRNNLFSGLIDHLKIIICKTIISSGWGNNTHWRRKRLLSYFIRST